MPPPPAYATLSAYPQPVPQQARRTSGLAIASLVLGVLWIYWLGSILALIFGYLAKRELRNAKGQMEGNGLATAGIVLGWVGVSTLVLVIGLITLGVIFDEEKNKPAEKSTSQHVMLFSPPQEPALASPTERDFPPPLRPPS